VKLRATSAEGGQNDQKNELCHGDTLSKCHFSAAHLREIWRQKNKSVVINPFSKELPKFFLCIYPDPQIPSRVSVGVLLTA